MTYKDDLDMPHLKQTTQVPADTFLWLEYSEDKSTITVLDHARIGLAEGDLYHRDRNRFLELYLEAPSEVDHFWPEGEAAAYREVLPLLEDSIVAGGEIDPSWRRVRCYYRAEDYPMLSQYYLALQWNRENNVLVREAVAKNVQKEESWFHCLRTAITDSKTMGRPTSKISRISGRPNRKPSAAREWINTSNGRWLEAIRIHEAYFSSVSERKERDASGHTLLYIKDLWCSQRREELERNPFIIPIPPHLSSPSPVVPTLWQRLRSTIRRLCIPQR